jgi:hypothetical protein
MFWGEPAMIACDTNQLHRIERTISALEYRSEADQMRLQWMREALPLEKCNLLGLNVSAKKLPRSPGTTLALGTV